MGLSVRPALFGVVLHEVGVGVPVSSLWAPPEYILNEPHTPFDQPSSKQALPAEVVGFLLVDAIGIERLGCLQGEVDRLGGVLLHLVGEL